MIKAIALLIVAALGIVAAYFKGVDSERGKQAEKDLNAVRKANNVDKEIDALSADDKRERLRNDAE